MEAIFIKLLNMSIAASWLVLAVILLRTVFRKMPKVFRCVLWALVGIRLLCPWFAESEVSLVPSAETVPENIVEMDEPKITTGVGVLNNAINPIIQEQLILRYHGQTSGGESTDKEAISVENILNIVSIVWIVGVGVMLLYYVVSYVNIRRKVRVSERVEDNVYICDNIQSAFILGIIKPRIYVPSYLSKLEAQCIIVHERAHLKNLDNIWKPLGFIILSVYWFNPVLWIAYILLCRDIELACDERVIRQLGVDEVKDYSNTLLSSSVSRRMIVAVPLAFGEVAVKTRVKSILNYKKPAFWIIVVAVVASVVVGASFLTNPVGSSKSDDENGSDLHNNEEQSTSSNNDDDEGDELEDKDVISYYSSDGAHCIELGVNSGIARLFCPMLSVKPYEGTYEMTADKLTLYFELDTYGQVTRVFEVVNDQLTYIMSESIQPEVVNLTLKDGTILLLDESDKNIETLIDEGILGCTERYMVWTEEEQLKDAECEYMVSTIRIDQVSGTFRYSWSPLSSYIISGTYVYSGGKLTLQAGRYLGGERYVFIMDGDKLIYSDTLSSVPHLLWGQDNDSNKIFGEVYILQDWY